MESRLSLEADRGFTARMTAGYCWPWSEPEKDGRLVPDVVVDDWQRPWNVKGERAVGGAPPSALWATDPAGFGQVGCTYTAQGFEYDWNGVIFGPDLVWRGDRWVAARSSSKDPAFRSTSKVSDEEFDRLVRNVYKVLMTRGMIGTLVYIDRCGDERLPPHTGLKSGGQKQDAIHRSSEACEPEGRGVDLGSAARVGDI